MNPTRSGTDITQQTRLFISEDGRVELQILLKQNTLWLTQNLVAGYMLNQCRLQKCGIEFEIFQAQEALPV